MFVYCPMAGETMMIAAVACAARQTNSAVL
jgi:hypothetical protein